MPSDEPKFGEFAGTTVGPADQTGPKPLQVQNPPHLTVVPLVLLVACAVLLIAVLAANFESRPWVLTLRVSLAIATLGFALVSADMIRKLRTRETRTVRAFVDNVHDFREMAEHIQEIFWIIDPRTKRATFVNPAYEDITGRSCQSLLEEPSSYEKAIHPDDRPHVLMELDQAARTGHFDERFRIVRPDGEVRWVWVRRSPRRDSDGRIIRVGGTALDITEQKRAEDQIAANLAKANSAWAEAEALRKATLALTEDLHMDCVLDALLRSLAELVPYTCARVLVPESGPHWLSLREKFCPGSPQKPAQIPLTFVADTSPFFQRTLIERKPTLLPDTRKEESWKTFEGHTKLQSWLGVPLFASDEFLGFLSVGHDEPNQFTEDHLRRAELLAIPAAVAIQNARLYSTAEIYGSELEKRRSDLEKAERALDQSEQVRRDSEEKFQKIFHSSPIAFSITTLDEGRFLDVNAAFECRYGYSRKEILGRTVHELRIWEDPADRRLLVSQLKRGGPVRNVVARLRVKSGEIKLTAYSADRIQFDGQTCVLAVSEDVSIYDPKRIH